MRYPDGTDTGICAGDDFTIVKAAIAWGHILPQRFGSPAPEFSLVHLNHEILNSIEIKILGQADQRAAKS